MSYKAVPGLVISNPVPNWKHTKNSSDFIGYYFA